MTHPIDKKFSTWTYQDLEQNGSNLTTVGIEVGTKVKNTNLSIYTGGCTSFKGGSTGALIDLKCSTPIFCDENITVSAGGRFRNVLTPSTQTGELRGQLNLNCPINENNELYFAGYVRGKTDYQKGGLVTSEGAWLGYKRKINDNIALNTELQGNFNNKTLTFTPMINVGLSVKF